MPAVAGGPGFAGGLNLTVGTDLVATLAARARRPGRRTVVIVDGRSGSGKTTLGHALAAVLQAQFVGLDDVYPGWFGLAEASEAVPTGILNPDSPGYRRWDWTTSQPADRRALDARAPIVVEGAGALTPASAALATLTIWCELDTATRRARALARDGASYEPWWEVWARQEEAHLAAHSPHALADVTVAG